MSDTSYTPPADTGPGAYTPPVVEPAPVVDAQPAEDAPATPETIPQGQSPDSAAALANPDVDTPISAPYVDVTPVVITPAVVSEQPGNPLATSYSATPHIPTAESRDVSQPAVDGNEIPTIAAALTAAQSDLDTEEVAAAREARDRAEATLLEAEAKAREDIAAAKADAAAGDESEPVEEPTTEEPVL